MDRSNYGIFIVNRYCEPCQFQSNGNVDPKAFCIDCDESQCSDCARKHKLQNVSDGHREIIFEKVLFFCQTCKKDSPSRHVSVESFCSTCKEFYCKGCGEFHTAQKCARHHELGRIPENHVVLLTEEYKDDTVSTHDVRTVYSNKEFTKRQNDCDDPDSCVRNSFTNIFEQNKSKQAFRGEDQNVAHTSEIPNQTQSHRSSINVMTSNNSTFSSHTNNLSGGDALAYAGKKEAPQQNEIDEREVKNNQYHSHDESTTNRKNEVYSFPQNRNTELNLQYLQNVPAEEDMKCLYKRNHSNASEHEYAMDQAKQDVFTETELATRAERSAAFSEPDQTTERGPHVGTGLYIRKCIPTVPEEVNVTAKTVEVRWEKPIDIKTSELYELNFKEERPGSRWESLKRYLRHDETVAVVENLSPESEYIFRVRVVDPRDENVKNEFSSTSKPIKTLKREDKKLGKPFCTYKQTTGLTLSWDIPKNISDKDSFQMYYKEKGKEDWIQTGPLLSYEQSTTDVEDLTPATAYLFKLVLINEFEEEESYSLSDLVYTDKREDKKLGKPFCTYIQTTGLTLSWDIPKNISDKDSFQMYYKEKGKEAWIQAGPLLSYEQSTTDVEDLTPATAYLFKLVLINEFEEEESYSLSDLVYTDKREDKKLGKLFCTYKQTTGLTLSWDIPKNISDKDSFQMYYKEKGKKAWIQAGPLLSYEQSTTDVEDLTPATAYLFKLVLINEFEEEESYSLSEFVYTDKNADSYENISGKGTVAKSKEVESKENNSNSSDTYKHLERQPNQIQSTDTTDRVLPNKTDGSLGTDQTSKENERRQPSQQTKPRARYVHSNHLTLTWSKLPEIKENEVLQVFQKEAKYGGWRKSSCNYSDDSSSCMVGNLRSDTQYVFKIRLMNEDTGEEKPYSSVSDMIHTKPSPAMIYKSESILLRNSIVYQLPLREDPLYFDKVHKIRRYNIGHQASTLHEKTILLIGESGSGKSTMIDCLANYSLGVTVQDPFRFTLTCGENADGQNAMIRGKTDWITIYTLHPSKESSFPFAFNLIDTPGLGEKARKGDKRVLITSIEMVLKRIEKIDLVGVVLKSSDSKLSVSQRLLFDSFQSMFGNDIAMNTCALITFCDSQTPPVVDAMTSFHRALPSNNYFCFNNCSLFSTKEQESNREAFWQSGKVQFDLLLKNLSTVHFRSVVLPFGSLVRREEIIYEIQHLEQAFMKYVCNFKNISKTMHAIQQNDTVEFEIESDVISPDMRPVSYKNQTAITCARCNKTCCRNCHVTNNCDNGSCLIFRTNGFCRMCDPIQCHYDEHINTKYVMERIPTKSKTLLKVPYMEREKKRNKLSLEKNQIVCDLLVILEKMTKCHNDLQQLSYHKIQLTTEDIQLTTEELINKQIKIASADSQSYPSGTVGILRYLKDELPKRRL